MIKLISKQIRLARYLIFVSAMLICNLAEAQVAFDVRSEINDAENTLEQYSARIDELLRETDPRYSNSGSSPLSYLGYQCPECNAGQMQCAIIGKILGFNTLVIHLENQPVTLEASLSELGGAARELGVWLRIARQHLDMSISQQASIWNLECIGNHGIPLQVYDARGSGVVSMEVERSYLWVYGDVVEGFYEQLVSTLNAHPEIQTVAIGSAGGSVRDAILSGLEIRSRGLQTQLTGACLSACPLVFMGGVERSVMRPFGEFGFHQIYTSSGAIPLSDDLYNLIRTYSYDMGINGDWVLALFYSAAPSSMNMQGSTLEQRNTMCANGLVTWFQRSDSIC